MPIEEYKVCANKDCTKYREQVVTQWSFCPYCGMKLAWRYVGLIKRAESKREA